MDKVSKQRRSLPSDFYDVLFTIILSEFDEIILADEKGVFSRVFSVSKNKFSTEFAAESKCENFEFTQCEIFQKSSALEILRQGKKIYKIHQFAVQGRRLITGIPQFDHLGKLKGIIGICRNIGKVDSLECKVMETEEILSCCRMELFKRRRFGSEHIATKNQRMKEVLRIIARTAGTGASILLTGETGVGKSFFAKMIHELSNNRKSPFIVINCGAIPETLVESEFFGYEEGAFTGANKKGKKGFFEIAQDGTIFLDEVSELQLHLQVKLLYVLQERFFYRLGGTVPIELKARILSASNKDLHAMVEKKTFRVDLFYRLNVIPIEIPALNERKEDLPQFIRFFLNKFNEKYGVSKKISPPAYEILLQYKWPGNIREMENMIERLILTCDGTIIQKECPCIKEICFMPAHRRQISKIKKSVLPLKMAVETFEAELIQRAMRLYKTTRRAAEALQVNQSTIVKKMQRFRMRTKVKRTTKKEK